MKNPNFILTLLLTLFSFQLHSAEFPSGPESDLTPGALCTKPGTLRYFERIPYCKRNVSLDTKREIFEAYRKKLGYTLPPQRRSDYKIDHLIPLCAGGSNEKSNLWPQHKSLYRLTDTIEALGCEKLSQGKLKQKDFVELIKKAKKDISTAPTILKDIKRL